jgi:hypothetical protein
MEGRVKYSHKYGEVYPNVWSDFEWVREHRDELLATHGKCVILVYEKQVVGKGETLSEAVEDAERRLPPEAGEITPITEILAPRQRIYRVHSNPS